MANTLLALDELPLVLSTSYGFDEDVFNNDQEIAKYVNCADESATSCTLTTQCSTVCNAYAQLGARGTSVFFCSGDNGVYSFPFNSECSATEFGPTFPSGCPL